MTRQTKSPIAITTGLLCAGLFLGTAPVVAHHGHGGHGGHHHGYYGHHHGYYGHHHHDYYDDDYYDGGAFLGGMVTNQILTNMELESDAERRPPPVQYGDVADHRSLIERADHPYQRTASSRMAELDKLAASGAITPKEYKDKRLAIVDDL
jgi:hypothetical protein